ncbi:SHOCT domain-containing protein [Streptomyces sp. enrichment culture]|uniref:SHOCT domain-containing protein n=1 Tax=Streptomyces sp. enrichment culture TaxID=1795815 RepID=UPI003F569846
MQTLAHFGDGGPGPWILLLPLFWALAIGAGLTLLRRTARHTGRGPGRPPARDDSPLTVLGRRFASGEIDEEEYWRRLSVLDEQFGPSGPR